MQVGGARVFEQLSSSDESSAFVPSAGCDSAEQLQQYNMVGRLFAKAIFERELLPRQLVAVSREQRPHSALLGYIVAMGDRAAVDAEACGTCGAPSAERALVEAERALAVLGHHSGETARYLRNLLLQPYPEPISLGDLLGTADATPMNTQVERAQGVCKPLPGSP